MKFCHGIQNGVQFKLNIQYFWNFLYRIFGPQLAMGKKTTRKEESYYETIRSSGNGRRNKYKESKKDKK